jgi:prephenate dehydrogenase
MARLLLIGTGLIGGSFALATKRASVFTHVVGYDGDSAALLTARRLKIVDETLPALRGLPQCDAILIATPPSAVADVLAMLRDGGHGAVPTFDTASVKRRVLDQVAARLGAVPPTFVPCHPMAGAERKGPEAARADLFEGSRVFVTPLADTATEVLAGVTSWWQACGAQVVSTNPQAHDAHVALTSHLPHLLAFAYTRSLGERWDDALPDYAGSGFRDFTRIAASDPALWRDIVDGNAGEIAAALRGVAVQVERFLALIRAGRFDDLEDELARARATQQRFAADRERTDRDD